MKKEDSWHLRRLFIFSAFGLQPSFFILPHPAGMKKRQG
jgi:hypothetical protein